MQEVSSTAGQKTAKFERTSLSSSHKNLSPSFALM